MSKKKETDIDTIDSDHYRDDNNDNCEHPPIARTLDGKCLDCGIFVDKMAQIPYSI